MVDLAIIKPTLEDVDSIFNLVENFARKGEILKRNKGNIAERIREFICIKDGNDVVGVASLRLFFPYLGEIRTLVIDEEYQGFNLGRRLVQSCVDEAKKMCVKDVFALTFKKGFFLKLGFKLIDKKQLPSNKIWEDCINCPFFPNCKEEAVLLSLK